MQINHKSLDDPHRVFLIAEIGSNHQHDKALAEELVHEAADAGADAVKFQTWRDGEIAADVPLPTPLYGKSTLREIFARGGLPYEWHHSLRDLAEQRGLIFLSTPFGLESARFLVEDVGVPALKIASGDLTYLPLLEYAASTGLPLLVSTGMATLAEVQATVCGPLFDAYTAGRVALLHCASVYPCPVEAVNLHAINTLRRWFTAAAIGWSDHSLSVNVVPALAIAMGATVVEKHLILDRRRGGIDAAHSLEPWEFSSMCEVVRSVATILGDARKQPHALEAHDRLFARRDPSDWLRPTAEARVGRWE